MSQCLVGSFFMPGWWGRLSLSLSPTKLSFCLPTVDLILVVISLFLSILLLRRYTYKSNSSLQVSSLGGLLHALPQSNCCSRLVVICSSRAVSRPKRRRKWRNKTPPHPLWFPPTRPSRRNTTKTRQTIDYRQ